jgi:hypothetical protein
VKLIQLAQDRVARSFEHGNENSGSIKGESFIG